MVISLSAGKDIGKVLKTKNHQTLVGGFYFVVSTGFKPVTF
jgi:hypothetical protein